MSRAWTRRTAILSVLVVAAVAAIVSYSHMQHLAERSGEEWRSTLIPLSVDGMLVASTLAIVDRRRAGLSAGWVPWAGLSLGILASLAANVAAARPDPIARIIAAWPPIAFAVAVETLVIVLRGTAADVPMSESKGHQTGHSEPHNPPAPVQAAISPPPAPSRARRSNVPETPDNSSAERARALLATEPGIGRRALSRRAGVSEYVARTVLAEAPRNGHAVLREAK